MKRGLLWCVLLPFVALAGQEGGLTLDEAIRIGLAGNRTLRASEARVEAAEARAGEAATSRLPMLKGEASYRRLSDVDPFTVRVPFLAQPIEISPVVLNTYYARVSLQQPLFTGFRISSTIDMTESGARAAAFDNANDREDLVLSITSAYWTLYLTRDAAQTALENVARLERYVNDAKNLLRAGAATRNDVLRIEVQLSQARIARIDAENDARVAAMNLNMLLARPVDTPIVPLSRPSGASVSGAMLPDSLTVQARDHRPDLQALRARVEASRAGVTAAQAGWWPQLALSGNYLYARPNSRYLPTRDEFKGTWDIGVVLTMDLWNWGQTARQTEQAQASLRQTEFMAAHVEDLVSLEVRRASLYVERSRDRLEVAGLAVQQAGEQVRMTGEKFRNGLATAADLLDAEVAYQQSTTTLSGARVEVEIARARLTRAVGSASP